MSSIECPKCHSLHLRRIASAGLLRKTLLRPLGYFPWECRFCKHTFMLKERGHGGASDSSTAETFTSAKQELAAD